jgi:hypothetical protein
MSRTLPITIAMLTLAAGPAHAYSLKVDADGHSIRWHDDTVVWTLDAAGARDLSARETVDAVRGAFDAWDAATPGLKVVYGGRVEDEVVGYDPAGENTNHVAFGRDVWAFAPDALAVTLSTHRQRTGELLDADIVVNEMNFEWAVGAPDVHDLQNAMTHEVGHFLGLAHSDVHDASMYASAPVGETEKRDLHDDDVQAARVLYPAAGGEAPSAGEPSRPEPGVGAAHRNDAVPPGEVSSEEASRFRDLETPSFGCDQGQGSGPQVPVLAALMLLLPAMRRRGRR